MKRIALILFACLFVTWQAPAEPRPARVATLVPVAHSMLNTLLQDTPVEVLYLPPKRLPINRIESWSSRNASKAQPVADAIVGFDSLWPSLGFYPAMRKENIAIVPVDIAIALLPGGEQVALVDPREPGYFWLNPANSIMMLGILRRDLASLWPQYAETINANAKQTENGLRELSLTLDDWLFEQQIAQIAVASPSLKDLALSLALPLVSVEQAKAHKAKTLYLHQGNTSDLPAHFVALSVDDFARPANQPFLDRWQQLLAE